MAGYKRYVVVALVIAAGVAAAWPFRHQRPVAPQLPALSTAASDLHFALPQDLTLQVHPQSGLSPAPELSPVEQPGNQLARPASFTGGNPAEKPLESLPAPPFLPMAYESLLVPVGSSPQPTPRPSSPVHEPLLPSADEAEAAERAKPGPLWRRHRIVEGDTLAGLAQRYLGDESRAGEIQVANLDRLASPEILPLGVTLLIPPRVADSAH